MAKFELENLIGDRMSLTFNYYGLDVSAKTSKRLELTADNGGTIVYTGKNFAYNGDNATAGTVQTVKFFNPDGKLLMTISDASYELKKLSTDVNKNFQIFERGDDEIIGSSVGDMLLYGTNTGNDVIRGLGGNDYFFASPGRNTMDGGAGTDDRLNYGVSGVTAGIDANLQTGRVENPWGKIDTVSGMENLNGTPFVDKVVGSNRHEVFNGQGGNDRIEGGGGKDTFEFEIGADRDTIVDFGKGDDSVELGGFGVDTFAEVKAKISNEGKNAVLDFGNGDEIVFLHMSKADFVKADFEFIW